MLASLNLLNELCVLVESRSTDDYCYDNTLDMDTTLCGPTNHLPWLGSLHATSACTVLGFSCFGMKIAHLKSLSREETFSCLLSLPESDSKRYLIDMVRVDLELNKRLDGRLTSGIISVALYLPDSVSLSCNLHTIELEWHYDTVTEMLSIMIDSAYSFKIICILCERLRILLEKGSSLNSASKDLLQASHIHEGRTDTLVETT
jgi:hypothetical protein